jgi:aminoglycoside phosphotransferase family enzyme
VRRLHRIQRRFLDQGSALLVERCRRIVDGHGDLRPEHIWLGPPVHIVDCLEFNRRLREVDPLDEIAFLSIECARLGGARYGDYIERRLCMALPDMVSDQLFSFYRCYRATLRARLSIAHLLEPSPRTPAKWRRQTSAYLALATANANRLENTMNRSPVAGGDGIGFRSCHA